MNIQLTSIAPIRTRLVELSHSLSTVRLNFLDLKNVPCIYMHGSIREQLKRVSEILDSVFYYEALMNKSQRATEWTQEGELEKVNTDPFNPDVRLCVDGFLAALTDLSDVQYQLGNLVSIDFRKPVKVPPDEIFGMDDWIDILDATYLLSCRSNVTKVVKEEVGRILHFIFKVVSAIAGIQITDSAIVIPVDEKDRETGLSEIVLTYQEEQVFFSEEELKQIEQDKRDREERIANEAKQRELQREIGSFKDELINCLVNTQWERDEQECVNNLFGNFVSRTNSSLSEEQALFLKTFKWYLEVTAGTGSVEDGLRDFVSKFAIVVDNSSFTRSGYVIAQVEMPLKGLHSMIKFFIDAGYTVETLESMTVMDGSLAMTTLHAKETMIVCE